MLDATAGDTLIARFEGVNVSQAAYFRNLAVGADVDRVGLLLQNATSTCHQWVDNAGNLLINCTALPTTNTDGTVVGTQTSIRETKQDIVPYSDNNEALKIVLDTPLYKFKYKNEVLGYGEDNPLAKYRIGYMADEADPQLMWGNAIDQVSVNGLLMAAIKEQQVAIEALKVELGELKK